jgi:hypothetical protein
VSLGFLFFGSPGTRLELVLVFLSPLSLSLGSSHKSSKAKLKLRQDMNNSILLNNMAVTMLQRSCHGQAFETFKDAIKITRFLIRNKQDIPKQHLLVNKAIHNISNPIHTLSATRLDAVSHDAGDVVGLRWPKSNKSNLLVRIDTSDEDILTADNHSFCLGIFLYNFGVVASLASVKIKSFAIDLLSCSLQLFEALVEDTKEDPYLLKRVVFLAAAVLEALIALLNDSRRETNNRTEYLEYLHEVTTSLDETGLFHECMERAAAAA